MSTQRNLVDRFHTVLVEEIIRKAPQYLDGEFTVAEIYQSLIPYRTHRDRLKVQINGDYEDTLLRLLAGEGGYLRLESEPARERIRKELAHPNPNTGVFRKFAAVGVRLDPRRIPADLRLGPGGERAGAGGSKAAAGAASAGDDVQTSLPALDEGADAPASPSRGRSGKQGDSPAPAVEPRSSGGGEEVGTSEDRALPDECPDCDRSLPGRTSLRFCPFCGANVFERPCSRCDEILERDWAFCVACGQPAQD